MKLQEEDCHPHQKNDHEDHRARRGASEARPHFLPVSGQCFDGLGSGVTSSAVAGHGDPSGNIDITMPSRTAGAVAASGWTDERRARPEK